ncbi:MAG: nucleoid-associated protein [Ruthenibacterium sp.]
MELEIHAAIVHVLDTALDTPVLSEASLTLSDDAIAYFTAHLTKLYAGEETRSAVLSDDSSLAPLLWNLDENFVQRTSTIARDWFAILAQNPAIPAGDVAFVLADMDGAEVLCALKLNYKTGYVHFFATDENGHAVNDIVRQNMLLPGTGGKADEAFFIATQTRAVRVLEKQYEIDGHKSTYLAQKLLCCRAKGLSAKETLSVIKEAAAQVNQQFYGNIGVEESDLAAAVCEEYHTAKADGAPVPASRICEKLYGDMPHAKEAFENALAEHEISMDLPLPLTPPAVRRMEKQSLRSGDGVEIKVPVSLYKDSAAVEFIHNADGSTSLLVKNILI